jgi:hypothetical protein
VNFRTNGERDWVFAIASSQAPHLLVSTELALATHRSNFLLMGASQVVAWIDWLRGRGGRPADDSVTTFFAVEIVGRRFLIAAEHFFPYIRPWVLLDELDLPRLPWR